MHTHPHLVQYRLLPESIPWLAANDRVKDAEAILKRAAKVNGVAMPDNVLSGPEQDHMIKHNDAAEDNKKKGFLARFKVSQVNTPKSAKAEVSQGNRPKSVKQMTQLQKCQI